MVKISVSTFQGHKTFKAWPFDAYIGEVYGKGRKHGYYIQLARGTQNLNRDVKRVSYKTKAQAERTIRKWITARKMKYDAEMMLKQLKGGRR
jgi:hypothetical protein